MTWCCCFCQTPSKKSCVEFLWLKRSPFTTSNTETSIIKSNVHQINLSNENIKHKHWRFQILKIVSPKNHFGILIYILSSKTFIWDVFLNEQKINNFLMNIWRNNWRFSIWCRKRTPLQNLRFGLVGSCWSLARSRNSYVFISTPTIITRSWLQTVDFMLTFPCLAHKLSVILTALDHKPHWKMG